MADSTSLLNLVPVADQFDLLAGYDDGNWPDAAAIAAAFPNKTVIRITVFPSDNEGDCLDVETGDAAPANAPGWVARRRQAGHGGPLVYCSESVWGTVRGQFTAQNVPEPGYWVAGYPGSVGQALYLGSVAHQWIDRGPYDESVVVDYLPGIDPVPAPPKPLQPASNPSNGDDMCVIEHTAADGTVTRNVFGVVNGVAYHWWQEVAPTPGPWSAEKLTLPT